MDMVPTRFLEEITFGVGRGAQFGLWCLRTYFRFYIYFSDIFLVYHRPPGGEGAMEKDTVHKLGSHARYGMQAHLLATLENISSQWNEFMRLL